MHITFTTDGANTTIGECCQVHIKDSINRGEYIILYIKNKNHEQYENVDVNDILEAVSKFLDVDISLFIMLIDQNNIYWDTYSLPEPSKDIIFFLDLQKTYRLEI